MPQVRPQPARRVGTNDVEVTEHGCGEGQGEPLLGVEEVRDRVLRLGRYGWEVWGGMGRYGEVWGGMMRDRVLRLYAVVVRW